MERRIKDVLRNFEAKLKCGNRQYLDSCICLLQHCIDMKICVMGKIVHAQLISNSLEPGMFVENTLINMYLKCGSITHAIEVFSKMAVRNVFTWTMLIACYIQQNDGMKAMEIFGKMRVEGIEADKVTFAQMLNACTYERSLEHGKRFHAQILRCGYESDVFIGNTLVGLYSKCGSIEDASQVFEAMSKLDGVSWNAIIAGYSKEGDRGYVLYFLNRMQDEGVLPNNVTFANVLTACIGELSGLGHGKHVHASILKARFEPDLVINSTLVDMYIKNGTTENANQVFDRMPIRNVVSWSTMIAGYAFHGNRNEALKLLSEMEQSGVKPNEITFINMLNGCSANGLSLQKGKEVHARIIQVQETLNIWLSSALLDMYVKCGSLTDAEQVFNNASAQDTVSWSILIAGFVQQGLGRKAIKLLDQMQQYGFAPNNITFVSILNGCTDTECLEYGKLIHCNVLNAGVYVDVFVGSALIDMYGKCGNLKDACSVFDRMPRRNDASWNAIIAAHALKENVQNSVFFIMQMQEEGIKPNEGTYINILSACANSAVLKDGKQIHAEILRTKFDFDILVSSSIIDMYARCGSMMDASFVFNRILEPTSTTWNIMISGYAQHGDGWKAFKLFEYMGQMGVRPNDVTFISVMFAFSHSNLVTEGCYCFLLLNQQWSLLPRMQHFACIIDILGRSGFLDEAADVASMIPFESNIVVWTSLLGACRIHAAVALAKEITEIILKIEPENTLSLVLLSSIYAAYLRCNDEVEAMGEVD